MDKIFATNAGDTGATGQSVQQSTGSNKLSKLREKKCHSYLEKLNFHEFNYLHVLLHYSPFLTNVKRRTSSLFNNTTFCERLKDRLTASDVLNIQ